MLSDFDIRTELFAANIVIDEFRDECLGTNSYDVHLGKNIMALDGGFTSHLTTLDTRPRVDCKVEPLIGNPHLGSATFTPYAIGEPGYLLEPGNLYLGVTEEYTETHGFVPFLEGKSSLGRLGMSVHITAGKGDDGFCGHWTMEITVVVPTIVYAGMPVAQLIYHTLRTPSNTRYWAKPSRKYGGDRCGKRDPNPMPQTSKMYKNFPDGTAAKDLRW